MTRTLNFFTLWNQEDRANRISHLMDGETRLQENRKDIINHIKEFFVKLYSKEEWGRPSLDDLQSSSIGPEKASWLEREFVVEEVNDAVFYLGKDKAPGPNGFPIAFFQHFWTDFKEEVMAFMKEIHLTGKLSMNLGASFIALILKKMGGRLYWRL